MGFVPIFLNIQGQRCLVVGGGEVAQRKVRMLAEAGACVTLISPQATSALAERAEAGSFALIQRAYQEGDMAGYRLVYAATNDPELNRRLFDEAERLGILINVADNPDLCSFIVPSILRRGRLHVAISTGGASPALARRLRLRLSDLLGPELEVLLEVLMAVRSWLKRHEPSAALRAAKLNSLADSDLEDAIRCFDRARAEQIIAQCLGVGLTLRELGVDLAGASIETSGRIVVNAAHDPIEEAED